MNSLSRPKHSPSTAIPDTSPWPRKHPQKALNKTFNDNTQLLPPFSALSLADQNYIMNNFSVSNNSDEDLDDDLGDDTGNATNFSIFNDSSTNSSSSSLSSAFRRSSSSSIQSAASSVSSDTGVSNADGYQSAPRYSALASLHNDSLNRRLYSSKPTNDNIQGSIIGSKPVVNPSSLLEQKYIPRPLPRTPKKTQKSYGALGTVLSNTPRKRIIQPTFHYHESTPQRQKNNVCGSPNNKGKISPNFGSNDSSPIIMTKKRISLERNVPRVVYSSNQVYPSNNSDEEDFGWDGGQSMNQSNNNFHSQRWQRRTQSTIQFTPSHRKTGSVSNVGSASSPNFDFLEQSPGRRCSPRHTELTPKKSSLKTHLPQSPYTLLPPPPQLPPQLPLLLSQRSGSQQGKRPLPCIATAGSGEKLGFYSKQDLVRRESDGKASNPSTARRVASYQKHSRRFSSSSVSANGNITGGVRSQGRAHRRNKSATVLPPTPAPPVRKRVAWAAILEW